MNSPLGASAHGASIRFLRPVIRLFIAIALAYLALKGLQWCLPRGSLTDFGSFFASGQAAARGQDPYGVYPLTGRVESKHFTGDNPNLNPPISVLFFQVLATFDPNSSFYSWWAMSLILYVCGVLLLRRAYQRTSLHVLWALTLAGFWETLRLGQVYVPLALAAMAAWLLLQDDQDVWAGLPLGFVVAWKPFFAVWPVLLLLGGKRRAAISALLTAVLLSLLPLLYYGPSVYVRWLAVLGREAPRAIFPTNVSLLGLASRLGAPAAGYAAAIVLLLLVAAWALKRQPDKIKMSSLAVVASLLVSPVAWVHYTLLLLPILFYYPWSWPLAAGATLLSFPIWVHYELSEGSLWMLLTAGSVYNWAVLLVFVALAGSTLIAEVPARFRSFGRKRG